MTYRPGFDLRRTAAKPWGTGHAVLSLRSVVAEPFLVANADDFYGPNAIKRLVRRIRDGLLTGDPSHFLAGYELHETGVPADRGVNRGMLKVDASLIMERLEEIYDIRETVGEYVGRDGDGKERSLQPERLCSMNLWAFQPTILGRLESAFQRFHARLRDASEGEFLLSEAVGGLVETGQARVRVVPADDPATGLTHAEDLSRVRSAISLSVAVGAYPTDLGEWFEGRAGRGPG